MTTAQKLKSTLESAGIPFIKVECYGRQITIEVQSYNTAKKWAGLLGKFSHVRGIIESIRPLAGQENQTHKKYRKIHRVYACME